MDMRVIVVIILLVLTGVGWMGCTPPERPAKDGLGELAVTIDREFAAPVTHSPLDWWQTHHFLVINSGDIKEKDCLYCHQPARSCNNCHSYVGVRPVGK